MVAHRALTHIRFAMLRRRKKSIRIILLAVLAVLTFNFLRSHQPLYPQLASFSVAQQITGTRSVFVASTQWNSAKLLEEHWIPKVTELVDELRAANISAFISNYKSGS